MATRGRKKGNTDKYRKSWDEKSADMISKGASIRELAECLGVSTSTLWHARKCHKSLDDAIRDAYESVYVETEDSLLKRATGYNVEETSVVETRNAKGELLKTTTTKNTKHIPAADGLIKFILTNKLSAIWQDRRQVDLDATVTQITVVPPELED
jgi:hypothetical protein